MEKITLNLAEAAEVLGLGLSTMKIVVHQPGFPALKVGRRWIIAADALYEWVNTQSKARAVIETEE